MSSKEPGIEINTLSEFKTAQVGVLPKLPFTPENMVQTLVPKNKLHIGEAILEVEESLNRLHGNAAGGMFDIEEQSLFYNVPVSANDMVNFVDRTNWLVNQTQAIAGMKTELEGRNRRVLGIDVVETNLQHLGTNLIQVQAVVYTVLDPLKSLLNPEETCRFRTDMDYISAAKALQNRYNNCPVFREVESNKMYWKQVGAETFGDYPNHYYDDDMLYSSVKNNDALTLDADKWNAYYDRLVGVNSDLVTLSAENDCEVFVRLKPLVAVEQSSGKSVMYHQLRSLVVKWVYKTGEIL